MRWCVSIGAMLFAGAIAGAASAATSRPGSQLADSKDGRPAVDIELIIAVDVSYSMDLDELAVQREGYAQAIVSKEFLQALKNGPNSKVAVTYFEWSASSDQKIIIPWRVIDGPETADAVANEIMKTPVRRGSRTSISGAINFAMPLFEENPYRGLRRVIDISGDGPNNNGAPVAERARRGAGEGHHHQRPADHGEGAVLFDDGYRQPRLLLRGLRDRRAGLVRGLDQGPRQVQGGDPDQAACSKSRAARRSDGPSRWPRKSRGCPCHDRRENLAGSLGAMSGIKAAFKKKQPFRCRTPMSLHGRYCCKSLFGVANENS